MRDFKPGFLDVFGSVGVGREEGGAGVDRDDVGAGVEREDEGLVVVLREE